MPKDSIWKDSSFAGHTCSNLEQDFGEGNSAAWCETLSRGVFSDHTPMDACCACGGGYQVEAYSSADSLVPDIVNYYALSFTGLPDFMAKG